jgi:serine/threonine protein kinase
VRRLLSTAWEGRLHVEGLRPPDVEPGKDPGSWGFAEGDAITADRHSVRLLGGGSRYEAYLAWDDDLHCLVVVKILRPDQVGDPSALRGLAAEERTLEALQHPVMLRCFDSLLQGPRPHLVLEFLEGPRLSTLVRRFGALGVEQVIALALELCSALHYMGARRMLHLDVKPSNIIMGAPPRLIDLSVARSFDAGRRLDHLVGTDAYMAPEQCDPVASGGVGPAADVWGLGVSLYEAATGTHPFPGMVEASQPPDRRPRAHVDPAPLPGDLPRLLGEHILACLEHEPVNRPRPAELASGLEELVARLPRRPVLGKLKPRLR